MEQQAASRLIADVDERDHADRTERLVELTRLLPDEGMLGFSGQAAEWLFDDIKATWLYGCFVSTVLTAHAFCSLQLGGWIRLLPDNADLPDEAGSLEELSGIALRAGILTVDLQAALIELHDRCRAYTAANLHRHELRLERHLIESEDVTPEDPLLLDARLALTTAVRLVFR